MTDNMPQLTLQTQPTDEPVSLAEMRIALGITDVSDVASDANINSYIATARQDAEVVTKTAVMTQSWLYKAPCFLPEINLKLPLQSVTSVRYLTPAGAWLTLANSEYDVDTYNGRIYLAYEKTWPETRDQFGAVEIVHVSGYQDQAAVPQHIKTALALHVKYLLQFNDNIAEGVITRKPYQIGNYLQNYTDLRSQF